MKKSILIFATVGTAIMLAACSGGTTTPTTAAPAAETTAAAPETTAAPAETTAAPAETTAAPEETTVAEPETTEAEPETTEAEPETTEAEPETTLSAEEMKEAELAALAEEVEDEEIIEDNQLTGLWVLEDDPEGPFCFCVNDDGTFTYYYENGMSEGTYTMTSAGTAKGQMDGEGDVFMSTDRKGLYLVVETSEAVMEFVRDLVGMEIQATSPFVDYWYVNGDTDKGYILFNEDQSMEVLNSEGTLTGTWDYEDNIVTATVKGESAKFMLTEDDTLVQVPDDGNMKLVRGSACKGLTLEDSGNRGMGQDIVIQGVDATHTKARNYDVEAAVTYPDEMEYLDYFYDAVCAGSMYSDSYVVVRNITDWWSTFGGYNEDLMREYAESYIKDDFSFLYGSIEGEMGDGARPNSGGNCIATYTANYWNGSCDILVKAALYELTYKNVAENAYIVKTAYVPIDEDSMMDYIWSEVKASGCRRTYG